MPSKGAIKEGLFPLDGDAETTFQHLKTTMTTIPILALPNFSKPFIVENDAFGYGLRVVLMQEHRPIAFFSQMLSPQARYKSIYEKELMAIVLATQKWRHYLLGNKFIVRTDQRNLKY